MIWDGLVFVHAPGKRSSFGGSPCGQYQWSVTPSRLGAASPAYEAERNSTIERGPTVTLPPGPGGEGVGVVAGS